MVFIHKQYIVVILILCGITLAVLVDRHSFLAHLYHSYKRGTAITQAWICVFEFGRCLSFVGGLAVMKYGGAKILGVTISIGGLMNLLIPTPNQNFETWPKLVKFVHGALQGFAYSAIADIWAKSAPSKKITTVIAITATSEPLVAILLNYLTYDIHSEIYYFHHFIGGIATIWAVVWLFYIRHQNIENLSNTGHQLKQWNSTGEILTIYPWKQILDSYQFRALCAVSFVLGGTYINRYFPDSSEFTSPVNFNRLVYFLITGIVIDYFRYYKHYSVTKIYRSMLCTAFVVQAVIQFLSLCHESFTGIIFYNIMAAFRIISEVIMWVNVIDLSPNYVGLLSGIQRTFFAFGSLLPRNLLIRVERTPATYIFFAYVPMYLFAAIAYYLWGSGERQSWNNPSDDAQEMITEDNVP